MGLTAFPVYACWQNWIPAVTNLANWDTCKGITCSTNIILFSKNKIVQCLKFARHNGPIEDHWSRQRAPLNFYWNWEGEACSGHLTIGQRSFTVRLILSCFTHWIKVSKFKVKLTGRPWRLSKYSRHFCSVIFSSTIWAWVISCTTHRRLMPRNHSVKDLILRRLTVLCLFMYG